MSAGLQITRAEHSNCKLRLLASRCRDGAEVRRLLTLAMVLHGHLCSAAASCNSKDRQTLRDWVHRDNEAGVEGLNASPIPGRTPFLTARQRAELYELVVKGADLATAKWRAGSVSTYRAWSRTGSRSKCTKVPSASGCTSFA